MIQHGASKLEVVFSDSTEPHCGKVKFAEVSQQNRQGEIHTNLITD